MIDSTKLNQLLDIVRAADLDYQEWVNVGMALHDEGLPCSTWADWSAKDAARFHPGECERKWKTFGNGMEKVTIGTLYHMAEERGFTKETSIAYNWDDLITDDGEGWHHEKTWMTLPAPGEDYNPVRDVTDYLTALFDTDDHVCYVTSAYADADGKYKPYGGTHSRTCGELLGSIRRSPDLTDTFGTTQDGAGAWVCFNPMDGKGRGNANVTNYRYALVESDSQSIDAQFTLMQDLRLPIKMLVHSGGKSLHAIVSIDACDYKQYKERVDYLYTVCQKHGLNVDTQDKNPARLSRLPGFKRGENWQYIVAHDIGEPDFVAWRSYIENDAIEPLEKENLAEVMKNKPPLRPELIKGVLRCGHKMILSAPSKAGKTFALIELAICIAEGIRWLGYECRQGKVLYLNMELDPASFFDRMDRMYKTLEIENRHMESIDIVNLRGRVEELGKLVPRIIRTMRSTEYAAVILDPIYKLGIGDENAADQVTKFCNSIDRIATATGASIIFTHHHSKGVQGQKASMDRASGSGVFARDPDAMLDMMEVNISDDIRDQVTAKYGENATAWKLEMTLREFAQQKPKMLFFSYPEHIEDTDGWLDGARLQEEARALEYGREKGAVAVAVKKQNSVEALQNILLGDEIFGRYRTVNEYAEDMKVSAMTAKRYLEQLGYGWNRGQVYKCTNAQTSI